MIGVNGAQRLNNYIHETLPKTYQAIGVLGKETPTGDLTVEPSKIDDSEYFKNQIADLAAEYIEKQVKKEFIGEYQQAPHVYSAAKHEGKPLHEWARAGIEIKKKAKLRYIYEFKVISYHFPEVHFEAKVSSGTYIRSLFSDIANELGTLGTLKKLVRTKIGTIDSGSSLLEESWPLKEEYWDIESHALNLEKLLPFQAIDLNESQLACFKHGRHFKTDIQSDSAIWLKNQNQIVGLGYLKEDELWPKVNFNC